MAETFRRDSRSSSRTANRRKSRISLGERYWAMKLSSLKLRMAKSKVSSQGLPAISGNHLQSSSVGCSQIRLMSCHMENPKVVVQKGSQALVHPLGLAMREKILRNLAYDPHHIPLPCLQQRSVL